MSVELGLSLMVEDGFARAVLPLLEDGAFDALEYSFEIGWAHPLPSWAESLLDHFADAGRLWGHGVTLSPLTNDSAGHHDRWLERAEQACARWTFRGVSEHYGFMREAGVDGGAPLPPPPGPATVARGVRALQRLSAATGAVVGLENLALALSPRDVWQQGPTLAAMLEPVDGYLVLDLHNLHCQVENFAVDPEAVLDTYPLDRVRCMHVSGGSWSEPVANGRARRFRRDTHDDAIPTSVVALLATALRRCPHVETVIVERLGPTIRDEADAVALRRDVESIQEVLA